jgi:hypothetical protein
LKSKEKIHEKREKYEDREQYQFSRWRVCRGAYSLFRLSQEIAVIAFPNF